MTETSGWEGAQTEAAGSDSTRAEFQIKLFLGKRDASESARVPQWLEEHPGGSGALIALG